MINNNHSNASIDKTSSPKKSSGRNPKETDKDRRALKMLTRQHKTIALKVTAELETPLQLQNPLETVKELVPQSYKPGIF